MACNCATDEMLQELYKRYGEKQKASKPKAFKHKVKYYLTNFGVAVCMIPMSVYVLFYILYKTFVKKEKISLAEFFKLR